MSKRQELDFQKLRKMFPQQIDKLPMPAQILDKRWRWVGFTWVEEGDADGTEPLLIFEKEEKG